MPAKRRALLSAVVIVLAAAAGALADPAPGDANGDGFVDDIDYAIWSDNYAPGVGGKTWQQGDFNGDGIVDGADYTIWAAHRQNIPFRADIEIENNTGQAKTNWPVFLVVWKLFGGNFNPNDIHREGFRVFDAAGTEIPHMLRQMPPDFSTGNDEIVFIVPAMAAGEKRSYFIINTAQAGLTQEIDLAGNANNLLPNGGFETDTGGVPTGYALTSGSASNISYDTLVKRQGARSMKLTYPVESTLKLRTASRINFQYDRRYHFSLWARSQNMSYTGYGFNNCGFWTQFDQIYYQYLPGKYEWRYPFVGRGQLTLRDNREWFCYRFDAGGQDGWAVPGMGPQGYATGQSYFYLNGYQRSEPFVAGAKTGTIWLDEALLFEQPVVTVDRKTILKRTAKDGALIFSRPVNMPRYRAFRHEAVTKLSGFAMQGERRQFRFGVHATRTLHNLQVQALDLTGPGGTIPALDLDIEKLGDFVTPYATTLELAADNTVEYLLGVEVPPSLQAGTYKGGLAFLADGLLVRTLPLELEVLPVQVPSMEGYWVGGIYNVGYALVRDDRFYRCYGKARFNYMMLFDYFSTPMIGLDVDLPGADQQVDKLVNLAHVTGGIGLYREPNMSEDQPRKWYQIAAGIPDWPGAYKIGTDPQYKDGYQDLAEQLETHAQASNYPTMIYMVSDEPDKVADVDPSMGWLNERLPGAVTVCDAQYKDMLLTWNWYNLPSLDDPADWTGPMMYEYVRANKGRFGFCGTAWGLASGRYQPGLMLAASGGIYWHWWHTSGPFDYLDGGVVRMHHIAAMAAGVNDLRYYLTLKQRIAAGSDPTVAAQAQAYLDGIFSFCNADHDRHLLPYNGIPNDWGYDRFYDDWRATMKDYILLLAP